MIKVSKQIFEEINAICQNQNSDIFKMAVKLKNGKFLNTVFFTNIDVKYPDIQINEISDLDDSSFDDAGYEEDKSNYIVFENVAEILPSKNEMTKEIYSQLSDIGMPEINFDDLSVLAPAYIFSAKMRNGEILNFRIEEYGDGINFMDLPEGYSNKDLIEIYDNKIFYKENFFDKNDPIFNEEIVEYESDLPWERITHTILDEIEFIELAVIYTCEVSFSELLKKLKIK